MKNYKRQIALSDVHGEFGLLKDLIENQISFDPETDMLLMLGDFIDRSRDSKLVVEYIKLLKEQHPEQVILLKGSHEEMAYYALTEAKKSPYLEDPMQLWLMNGGQATIESFGGIEKTREILVPFIKGLKVHFETETHIFVHGGIPVGKTLKTAKPHELIWDRNLTYEGEKILVVGHTPHREVTRLGNLVCIDTGAFKTGKLSAYDCMSGQVYAAIDKNGRKLSKRS